MKWKSDLKMIFCRLMLFPELQINWCHFDIVFRQKKCYVVQVTVH